MVPLTLKSATGLMVAAMAATLFAAQAPAETLVPEVVDSGEPASFGLIDNGDGTITDASTGLMWLQDANSAGFSTWDAHKTQADNLVFAGFSDWRLPSALNSDGSGPTIGLNSTDNEFGHLFYISLGNAAGTPLTNTGPFTNVQQAFYWTVTEGGLGAFEFDFFLGSLFSASKTNDNPFWAVRGPIPTVEADVGQHTDVAVDSLGRIHVSYYDATNGDLKWARKDSPSANWIIRTVDSADDVGLYSAIAIGSDNRPRISYYDATNGDLKYARDVFGVGWVAQTVDPGGFTGSSDVGLFTDITLDSVDNAYISYYDNTNEFLKLAYQQGPSFNIEFCCDARIATGDSTSIALNGQTNPIIAYRNADGLHLNLALFDRAGVGLPIVFDPVNNPFPDWAVEFVRFTTSVVGEVSLALDGGGEPHISYIEGGFLQDLIYAKKDCLGFGCFTQITAAQPTGEGTWSFETVDSDVGEFTSIVVDGSGVPHVSYDADFSQPLNTLKYAKRNGTWNIQTVDSGPFGLGDFNAIAIAPDGPHISYYDASNGDLKHAQAGIEHSVTDCAEQDLLATNNDGKFDFILTNDTSDSWTDFHLRLSGQSSSGGPFGSSAVFFDLVDSSADPYVGPGSFTQPELHLIDVSGLNIAPGATYDFRLTTAKVGGFGPFFVIGECAAAGLNTPVGIDVVVQPVDEATGTSPVTLTFDDVTGEGNTTLVISSAGPASPSGFQVCEPPTYFDLSTTATTAAGSQIEVCIDLTGLSCDGVPGTTLQHFEDTTGDGVADKWVDVTTSVNSEVCGVVSSLSDFGLFVPEAAGVEGDLDGDGDVDFDDLSIVISCFGQDPAVCDPRADANGDGVVDSLDVSIVISNFFTNG